MTPEGWHELFRWPTGADAFWRAMVAECRRGIPACEGRALRVWMAALVLTPWRLVVFMPVVDLMGRVV